VFNHNNSKYQEVHHNSTDNNNCVENTDPSMVTNSNNNGAHLFMNISTKFVNGGTADSDEIIMAKTEAGNSPQSNSEPANKRARLSNS
jgi:hypothetical protein